MGRTAPVARSTAKPSARTESSETPASPPQTRYSASVTAVTGNLRMVPVAGAVVGGPSSVEAVGAGVVAVVGGVGEGSVGSGVEVSVGPGPGPVRTRDMASSRAATSSGCEAGATGVRRARRDLIRLVTAVVEQPGGEAEGAAPHPGRWVPHRCAPAERLGEGLGLGLGVGGEVRVAGVGQEAAEQAVVLGLEHCLPPVVSHVPSPLPRAGSDRDRYNTGEGRLTARPSRCSGGGRRLVGSGYEIPLLPPDPVPRTVSCQDGEVAACKHLAVTGDRCDETRSVLVSQS